MTLKRIGGLVVICCLIFMCLYKFGLVRFNYPSSEKYPIRGIDISHHQDTINWNKLSEKDIKFVYIKATEGQDFTDQFFKLNCRKAELSKLDIGFYHFFRFCTPGLAQGKFFVKQALSCSSNLPPVIDLEFNGNCELSWSDDRLNQEIHDFLRIVEEELKRPVVLYTTTDFFEKHIKDHNFANEIWIRNIFHQPEKSFVWKIWQYSDNTRIKGVKGNVDINVFNGSVAEYEEFKNHSHPKRNTRKGE